MNPIRIVLIILLASCWPNFSMGDQWTTHAPRQEISPEFDREDGLFTLRSPGNRGTNGHWRRDFPVVGGQTYRFQAVRKAVEIEHPRRSCGVRIEWYGEDGKNVLSPEPVNPQYFGQTETIARPEFPTDQNTDAKGWTSVAGTYIAPEQAVSARVKLFLRWTEHGTVTWKNVDFSKVPPRQPREVVLAAVHHNLPGRKDSPEENFAQLSPLIESAAKKGADLIVLPELLTCKGVTHDYASLAEPVPGKTTRYFGELAKKHDCYIVTSLVERDQSEVFNTAVLMGPDGEVVGKYRKVTLPREEIERGISPGHEYPVFQTRFGKVGMMICYDVFFPEVAREIAAAGAEVIALPIWGGNPSLASARCAENGVYLVTSTYTDHTKNWMKTAIWDREGNRITEATEWGSIVVSKVDLNQRTYWHGLGDFQARIAREAPVRKAE